MAPMTTEQIRNLHDQVYDEMTACKAEYGSTEYNYRHMAYHLTSLQYHKHMATEYAKKLGMDTEWMANT